MSGYKDDTQAIMLDFLDRYQASDRESSNISFEDAEDFSKTIKRTNDLVHKLRDHVNIADSSRNNAHTYQGQMEAIKFDIERVNYHAIKKETVNTLSYHRKSSYVDPYITRECYSIEQKLERVRRKFNEMDNAHRKHGLHTLFNSKSRLIDECKKCFDLTQSKKTFVAGLDFQVLELEKKLSFLSCSKARDSADYKYNYKESFTAAQKDERKWKIFSNLSKSNSKISWPETYSSPFSTKLSIEALGE